MWAARSSFVFFIFARHSDVCKVKEATYRKELFSSIRLTEWAVPLVPSAKLNSRFWRMSRAQLPVSLNSSFRRSTNSHTLADYWFMFPCPTSELKNVLLWMNFVTLVGVSALNGNLIRMNNRAMTTKLRLLTQFTIAFHMEPTVGASENFECWLDYHFAYTQIYILFIYGLSSCLQQSLCPAINWAGDSFNCSMNE